MKWYRHDPAAFLEGVIGLDAEERGFYITVIDLLYARDCRDVTDALVCQAMACRPQVWRRVKTSLMGKGKVRETNGKLTANRVETTLQTDLKLRQYMRGLSTVSHGVSRSRREQKQQLSLDGAATEPIPKPTIEQVKKPALRASRSKPRIAFPAPWPWPIPIGQSEEFERFHDHALANARVCADWEAAWRNWLRSPYRRTNGAGGNGRKSIVEVGRELADEWREREQQADAGLFGTPKHARST